MRKRPLKTETKVCPFVAENCMKGNCELYNDLLDTCQLGLLNYNIYQLMTVMKKQIEIEMNKRI